jgi:hypothetical protein
MSRLAIGRVIVVVAIVVAVIIAISMMRGQKASLNLPGKGAE